MALMKNNQGMYLKKKQAASFETASLILKYEVTPGNYQ
jgi:hypothetical protein